MVDVLFFASLREQLKTERAQFSDIEELTTIADLKQLLAARGEVWAEVFQNDARLLCSINHEMANDQSIIKSGDEVAFFPPVTGG